MPISISEKGYLFKVENAQYTFSSNILCSLQIAYPFQDKRYTL